MKCDRSAHRTPADANSIAKAVPRDWRLCVSRVDSRGAPCGPVSRVWAAQAPPPASGPGCPKPPQVESPKFPKSPGRRKPTPNMTRSLTFHSPHVLIALIKCLLCAEHSTVFNRGR